jgi:hypothetical protein
VGSLLDRTKAPCLQCMKDAGARAAAAACALAGRTGPMPRAVRRAPSSAPAHSSLVTRHSSLVTRHSSLVTRHLSLVTRHSSHSVQRHTNAQVCLPRTFTRCSSWAA